MINNIVQWGCFSPADVAVLPIIIPMFEHLSLIDYVKSQVTTIQVYLGSSQEVCAKVYKSQNKPANSPTFSPRAT